jgi:tetratricopeptide (TPR) repeat protein
MVQGIAAMNKRLFQAAPALAFIVLAGCATTPGPNGPAAQTTPRAAPPAGMRTQPQHDSHTMPAAALALAESADRAAKTQDWPQASRQLERALNIAPRNPLLWQRLAAVRFSQGEYRQAQTFALKSNAYAGGDVALQKLNWRIIAASRQALGDSAGAAQAERRAKAL